MSSIQELSPEMSPTERQLRAGQKCRAGQGKAGQDRKHLLSDVLQSVQQRLDELLRVLQLLAEAGAHEHIPVALVYGVRRLQYAQQATLQNQDVQFFTTPAELVRVVRGY